MFSTQLIIFFSRIESAERHRIRTEAVTKIKRQYYRYRIRKLVKSRQLKRFIIMNMADEKRWNYSSRDLIDANRKMNRAKKAAFDEAFVAACEDTKARIVKLRTPWIMEDISDQIRDWFREMYEAGGEFDKFPPAIKGGTILVIRGETNTAWEFAEFIKKRNELAEKTAEERKKVKFRYVTNYSIYYLIGFQIADEEKKKKAAAKEVKKQEKLKLKKMAEDKKKLAEKEGKQWEFTEKDFITPNFSNISYQLLLA